ncbi:MAG: hypothetical protein MZV63_53465 [Marinilabiliales bacterium]|nr:hypothetical protein [Marinilabiliales bacterium]
MVTSQIFDYFLGNEHVITMDKNLDLSYLVDAVALVYCDGVRYRLSGGVQRLSGF